MRVLFLTHRLPYAPDRGDRMRAFHMLRTMRASMDVDLVSLVHDPRERDEAPGLASRLGITVTPVEVPWLRTRVAGAAALVGTRPLTHVLLDSPRLRPAVREVVAARRPDVVLAYCSGMARLALEPPLEGIPFVLDMVDVDSEKWADLGRTAAAPLSFVYRREARRLGDFERVAVSRAHTTFVVNEREADVLHRNGASGRIQVLPIGVDVDRLVPASRPTEDPEVVFCGVMNYTPNVEGVLWFAKEVWPIIRRTIPAARFTIVGSDPVPAIRQLADTGTGIVVTGRVPEVVPYLWRAAVAIAPLIIARGVQNKVLEAVTAGLPAVVTTSVLEGLPNEVRVACRVADGAEEFARHVVRLLRTPGAERRAMAARAKCSGLTWDRQLAELPLVLRDAAGRRTPQPTAASAF